MDDLDGKGYELPTAPAGTHGDRGGVGKRPYAQPCVKRLGGANRGTANGTANWIPTESICTGVDPYFCHGFLAAS